MRLSAVLLCCVVGGVWFSAGALGVPQGGLSSVGSGSYSDAIGNTLVIPQMELLNGGEQSRAQTAGRLADPQAQALRLASRTRFEHLGAGAVDRLAADFFPTIVNEPSGGAVRLLAGGRISRYLGTNAADVTLPNGKHGVIEALEPIARPTAPGRFAALNLSLKDAGSSYVPAGATLSVHIPKRLSVGVSMPGNSVSLVPSDAHGTPLSGSAGALDGASVVYANTQTDADTLVKPTTSGFEVDAILRSVDSPSRLYFRVGMPAGARLVHAGHSDLVRVVKGGATLAMIAAPYAQDATGMAVPVSVGTSGDFVHLAVDLRSARLQYPIAVDPWVIDEQLTGESHGTRWKFCASDGPADCSTRSTTVFKSTGWGSNGGLTNESASYSGGKWASLKYVTQGESKITSVDGFATGTNPSANIETNAELLTSGGTLESREYVSSPPATSYSNASILVCAKNSGGEPSCTTGVGSPGNYFRFIQSTGGSGSNMSDTIKNTAVEIQQSTNPTASFNTSSPTIKWEEGGKVVEQPNVLYGSGRWLGGKAGAYEIQAKDTGIGISYVGVSVGTWVVKHAFYEEGKCEGVQCFSKVEEPYTYAGQKDGEDTFELYTQNQMVGSHATATANIKVDGTAPFDLAMTGLPASGEITGRTYNLHAQAADGSGSTISSGIASLKLTVDGQELTTGSSEKCEPGPCAVSGEWTLDGEGLGAGEHTLTVVATDNAGNPSTREYPFTVRHGSPLAVGDGQVDPGNGALTLTATDVNIGAGGGALTISRAYNSRRKAAVVNGHVLESPVGRKWTLDVGAMEKLEKTPSNDVVLTGGDRGLTTFSSNGEGGFTAPKGDANLSLTEIVEGSKIKEFLVKDAAVGTTTHYTLPVGATEGPYYPEKAEGGLASSKETYTFKQVEVGGDRIVEPTQVLAPVPAGVSCSPTLVQGCRALTFNYATATTATGEAPSEWGDYNGDLTRVYLTAWDTVKKEMKTTAVSQYSYDSTGRLRTEWDPRITPSLKTTYGYGDWNRITTVSPPGQQPEIFSYGILSGDTSEQEHLLSVSRPSASTSIGSGPAPVNTTAPTLSSSSPVIGTTLSVSSNGTWNNGPLSYSYEWKRCNTSGLHCITIPGAVNPSYTPQASDAGGELKVFVKAINADGTGSGWTSATEQVALPVPAFTRVFGTHGSAKGQFEHPQGDAIDPHGNVWVADSLNNRIEKFSAFGEFKEPAYGTEGGGNLQFRTPAAIAINQESGEVYVADQKNNRIEVLNEKGEFVHTFGVEGSGGGQLKAPSGVAIDPGGDVWVADTGNNRIEKFTPDGVYMAAYGSSGSGAGQFNAPTDVAVSGEDVYVTDRGNNRVEEFLLNGAYYVQFGSAGSGAGQFSAPTGIASDPVSGELYVTDRGNSRIEIFDPLGTYLASVGSKGSSNGQFSEPEGLALNASGDVYVVDTGNNRVEQFTHGYSTSNPAPAPPSVGSSAVTTVDYQVPVSGSGAPYEMGAAEVKAWGQEDDPAEAVAVFPPDSPEGWPAQSYTRATVTYLDAFGRTVNVASPGGGISTVEYNEVNDQIRTLTPDSRVAALKEGLKSAEASRWIDTQSTYSSEGTELLETLGPRHTVKLSSGTEAMVRNHVVYSYNEGAPTEGGPYRLLTKTVSSVQLSSGGDVDSRTTKTYYSGQSNLGWKLRKPTSTIVDPEGQKLVKTTVYDPVTGNVVETGGTGSDSVGVYAAQYGSAGNGNGQVSEPHALTVNGSKNVLVADTGNNRIEQFTPAGAYVNQVGTVGTGNSQFKSPQGIAAWGTAYFYVADTGNNRIQRLRNTEYLTQWGTEGEGNGQFKKPTGVAVSTATTNVYVVDSGNYRVQEFSSTGTYITQFGSKGTGHGQFVKPYAIAMNQNSGDIYVSDVTRIEEFSSSGEYLREFGNTGAEPEQLSSVSGLAIDQNGNVWATDASSNRVVVFAANGSYLGHFGYSGAGNGQVSHPEGVTVTSNGHIYVSDTSNSRLEEWTQSGSLGYHYSATFGSNGSGNGQFESLEGVATSASGMLYGVDTSKYRVEEFAESGEYLRQFGSKGNGNGQFQSPRAVAISAAGNVYVTDITLDRVQEFTASGEYLRQFGSEGTGNGQFKAPEGIAVSPSGNVFVVDKGNNRVEKFTAEGAYVSQWGTLGSSAGQFNAPVGIAVSSLGNVYVADTGNSRVEKFSESGTYLMQFGASGSGAGQFGSAQGVAVGPGGDVAVVDGNKERVEVFTASGEYQYQLGEGSAGQVNTRFTIPRYVAATARDGVDVGDRGNYRIQEWRPGVSNAVSSQTIYYTAQANHAVEACGSHPVWDGLVCQTQPAAQPKGGVAPALPVTASVYNMWDEPETTTETIGSTTRTKTTAYDGAGRETSSSVTSGTGTAVPTTYDEYSESTGALIKQRTTVAEKTMAITSAFNTLGQLTSYTDADGNVSTYTYNVDGQTEEVNDGKGSDTFAYDPTTHALTKLLDTATGTFTASYDIEGRMTSEGYPNGMSANYTYDVLGSATGLEYVKTTHCTEKCTWFSQSLVSASHGETVSMTSSLASDSYTYDSIGRLAQTQETPVGGGCKTRIYGYDEESNRTSLTAREPGTEGKCATEGGTVESHAYDEANRLIDSGVSYDAFGDTLKLPAADAGGYEVTSSYYVSGQLLSQTQNGKTLTYSLDPAGRIRETVTTGTGSATVISHYSGGSTTPAWTSESSEKWTRNVPAIDGALGAVQTNGETPILQLHDLQGNVVGTAALSETETKLLSSYNSTEFGVPTTSSPPKYSWMGATGTTTELASGISNSDTTSYVPQLGLTLQTEPIVPPGSSPEGTYTGAPYVTELDPALWQQDAVWGAGAVEREAARQTAAAAAAALAAGPSEEGEDPQAIFGWRTAFMLSEKIQELIDKVDHWSLPKSIVGLFLKVPEGIAKALDGVDLIALYQQAEWVEAGSWLVKCGEWARRNKGMCWMKFDATKIPFTDRYWIHGFKGHTCSLSKEPGVQTRKEHVWSCGPLGGGWVTYPQ